MRLSDLPEEIQAQILGAPRKARGKYHNCKTVVDGITFDSRKEARRYCELIQLLRAGEIADLRLQEDITIQEAYTTPDGDRIRAIRYRADFTYYIGSKKIIEDVKGRQTPEYRLKKKLLRERRGIEINEV